MDHRRSVHRRGLRTIHRSPSLPVAAHQHLAAALVPARIQRRTRQRHRLTCHLDPAAFSPVPARRHVDLSAHLHPPAFTAAHRHVLRADLAAVLHRHRIKISRPEQRLLRRDFARVAHPGLRSLARFRSPAHVHIAPALTHQHLVPGHQRHHSPARLDDPGVAHVSPQQTHVPRGPDRPGVADLAAQLREPVPARHKIRVADVPGRRDHPAHVHHRTVLKEHSRGVHQHHLAVCLELTENLRRVAVCHPVEHPRLRTRLHKRHRLVPVDVKPAEVDHRTVRRTNLHPAAIPLKARFALRHRLALGQRVCALPAHGRQKGRYRGREILVCLHPDSFFLKTFCENARGLRFEKTVRRPTTPTSPTSAAGYRQRSPRGPGSGRRP